MKWVSYTRSISSRIGEENPSNTIAEQNERIARYLKKCGCSVSEKYSDRRRTAEATEGFDKLVQDGMARKFDAVVVDSIFRCGRTLPFAIEALQRTFYPLGIQFAVVEDDFCSIDKTAEEVAEYFNGKTIDKIRSEFITNRQNHFEEGTLTHRQAKYGYALSEDRRSLVLNPESAQVVKLIFQMYLEDMKIPEIARALDVQGVQTPQVQMAKKKRSRTKNKWQDSTIRSILKNPLYIGKCTLTLAKAKRELEVPAIVSKTEFQKAQKKLESTRLPSRKKARKKPNLLFKKIYDKESGKGLLCRTSEDESQQIYSFDKGYRCFSGKAPFIESEKIFREILSALEKEKMQAAHIDRVLDLNPEKVKQCMDAGLLQYRKRANEIVAHLMAKDDERTAVYRQYEQGSILLEQVEEYEHQYQVAVQKQEAAFKKVMLAVNDIEKAFSHGNPWLMKFRAISIPEKLERTHLKEWLDHVWIVDFEQVEVILQESEWKRFFPEEWLNNGEEDCNTGTNFNRPAFQKMIVDLKQGDIKVIMVKDLSRLGRDYIGVGDYIEQIFPLMGVRFIAVNNSFDSMKLNNGTPGIEVAVSNLVNNMYSRDIAKKIRAALETNWKNGKATCTNVPFGYVWNKKGGQRWEIDPEAAPCVKKVFELALSGRNTTQIAYGMNELNLPTPGLYAKRKNLLMGSNPIIAPDSEMLWNAAIVWRILRRYEYTGALVMGRRKKIDVNTTSVRTLPEDKWIIAENAHEAIVTKDEYYQAQKAIRNVTPIQYKVDDDFALKGKICCGNCNRQLRHERQYGEMVFYCGYKRSAGKFSKCYGGYYREYSVNAKVARAIKTVFYALDVVNQGMQEKQSITVRCVDIEDLEKQAEAIRVEQIKLYESYADGVLRRDVYIEKKKTLSEKLAALQDSIRTEKEEQECADELDEEIRNLTKQASQKTYIGGLTKECVDAFVSMVYLYDDQTMKVEFNCEDVIRRALEKYGA